MKWLLCLWLMLVGVAPVYAVPSPSMTTSMDVTAYGSVHVGSSVEHIITVSNAANASADLTFTVASDNAAFVVVAPASGTLAPGASQQVHVAFQPAARGLVSATLTVSGNDGANPSDTFSVSGTGTSGNLVLSATAFDFGTVAVTGATSQKTLTISNPSPANEPLAVSLALAGATTDYSASQTTNITVAVGASVQITLTFDPTTPGTRTGSITVSSDDAFVATAPIVSLTGVGQGAAFSPFANALDFGQVSVGSFGEQTLTITNTGNASGTINTITSGNSVFTYTLPTGTTLPATIAAGASIAIKVRFTPVDGSIVSSNLTFGTSGTPATFQVALTGDGLYEAVSIVATGEPDLMIDLGNRRVGVLVTKVVTVTNVGETPVSLALPTSSDAHCVIHPVSPATLSAVLDPTVAATFEIRTTPTAVGAGACTITVSTSIPSTDTIDIAWNGVAPEVALASPATPAINFGVVDVDATAEIRNIVLDNTGSAPLAIGPCTVTGSVRFHMVTNCTNLMVAPGSTATLMIAFDPAVEASESAMLSIGVDALSTNKVMLALSGVGADQRLDLSALAVAFPDTNIHSNEIPIEYIDVSNPVNPATGVAETLTIASATTDSASFQLANEGPFTVEPGGMIRLAIKFHPTVAQPYDATLTIMSDASGTPVAMIALHGRGVIAGETSGGCCQAGGSANAPIVLVIVLALRRRRRRR